MARIAIVTGGSRGIGAATVRALARDGWDVCFSWRSDEAAAGSVARAVEEAGRKALAVKADTGDPADVERLFETCDRELGMLSGLVNNAGIHGPRGRVEALEAADIDRVLAVNVVGPMLACRAAIRRMSTKHGGKGGAIVNVSSGSAHLGGPGSGVLYSVSKGALNSLGIGLSQELGPEGIRVNTVAPGLIRTDMPPPDRFDREAPIIPMRRVGEAHEIAEVIAFLMSDRASYVSGANVRSAGGKL